MEGEVAHLPVLQKLLHKAKYFADINYFDDRWSSLSFCNNFPQKLCYLVLFSPFYQGIPEKVASRCYFMVYSKDLFF